MSETLWLTELEVPMFSPNHPLWKPFVAEAERLASEDEDFDWTLPLPGRRRGVLTGVRLRAIVRTESAEAAIKHLDTIIRRAGAAADASGITYTTMSSPDWRTDYGRADRY